MRATKGGKNQNKGTGNENDGVNNFLLQLVRNIDDEQILLPVCPPLSREPNKLFTGGRSIIQMLYKKFEELDVRESTPVKCRVRYY